MLEDTKAYSTFARTEKERVKAISEDPLAAGFVVFLLLFFFSGMAALIYEITWTRRLTLVFGNTVYSVSTVLVAFMGGLAFGSVWFGRLVDRRQKPIRMYAWLEIGIGISAIVLPFALYGLNPAYRFLYNRAGFSGGSLNFARFVLSTAVLIVPTTLMGATLPVLSKFLVRRADSRGMGIGLLYAINTLGAMAGCFLGGFVLPGWIGISDSEHLAAGLNIVIGLTAFGMSRRFDRSLPPIQEASESPREPVSESTHDHAQRLILILFGISGMLALGYEVIWTRILVFLLGSSIYSFSMILTVYLLGLTAGSLIMARFVDKLKKPINSFGWVEISIGLAVFAGMLIFRNLPFEKYVLKAEPSDYLYTNFLSVFIIILVPTVLMGATFPLAVKIYTRTLGTIGQRTGALYAVNTIGGILGSFLAGFMLIPWIGSKNSVLLLISASITAGLILLHLSTRREGTTVLRYAAAVLLLFPITGFSYGNDLMMRLSKELSETGPSQILAFKEDATAAVAVLESSDGFRMLSVNGVVMTILCTETQLMAHIPIALSQSPEDMLMICFGMGTTFVSGRRAEMNVDFVELCPYVVDTFKYFQKDPSMLEGPGVGKIIADGRNYVFLSEKTYDVITIDPPPPPWSAGAVNLYTKEFYELCRERLKPDGVICQWFPVILSSLTEDQYKMLLKTFMEVFPHTTVWSSPNRIGTYLIGTPEPLVIDKKSFSAYFDAPAIKKDLSLYSRRVVDGPYVLSLLLLDEDAAWNYVSDAPVLIDDLPIIEFPLFRNGPSAKVMNMTPLRSRAAPTGS